MTELTSERRLQLHRARQALARGDYADAVYWFWEDIEGFVARLDMALDAAERRRSLEIPEQRKDRVAKEKSERQPLKKVAWLSEAVYASKRDLIRDYLLRDPEQTNISIAAAVGCSNNLVVSVRAEMELSSSPMRKSRVLNGLKALLAVNPQISNKEAARVLGCVESSVIRARRRLERIKAYRATKE